MLWFLCRAVVDKQRWGTGGTSQSSFNSTCPHGVSSGHNDERSYDHESYDSFKPLKAVMFLIYYTEQRSIEKGVSGLLTIRELYVLFVWLKWQIAWWFMLAGTVGGLQQNLIHHETMKYEEYEKKTKWKRWTLFLAVRWDWHLSAKMFHVVCKYRNKSRWKVSSITLWPQGENVDSL